MTLATLPSTEYSIYFLSSIYCIILDTISLFFYSYCIEEGTGIRQKWANSGWENVFWKKWCLNLKFWVLLILLISEILI